MRFGLGIGLKNARNYNAEYAMDFNGTDEYLQVALPTNMLTNGTFETGVNTDGWSTAGTVTFNDTELGKTGNYCAKLTGTAGTAIYLSSLTIGKKYKITLKYKSDATLYNMAVVPSLTYKIFPNTSQWNTVYYTFTALGTEIRFRNQNAGTTFIDDIDIREDWKLDLNESYELIKHSMNRDFETTLGADIAGTLDFATWTVAGGGVVVDSNSLSASAIGGLWKDLLTVGKKYLVTIAGTNNHSGTVALRTISAGVSYQTIGNIPTGLFNTTFEFLADYTGLYVRFSEASTGNIDFTSITLREIPNLVTNGTFTGNATGWSLGTDWSYGSDKVTHVAGTASAVSRAIQSVNGKRYKISFEVKDYSAGNVYALGYGNQISPARTANGVYTVEATATSTNLNYGVYCDSAFAGSVDNIHVYEIPDYSPNQTVSGNNHTANLTLADKYAGSGRLKVTATGAGDSGSNHVKLPYGQFETLVAGNKYTYEGFAKVDPTSLTYGSNLIPTASSTFDTDGTAWWSTRGGTKSYNATDKCLTLTVTSNDIVGLILSSAIGGGWGIYRLRFKARSATYTGKMFPNGFGEVSTAASTVITKNPNMISTWQDYEYYTYSTNGAPILYTSITTTIGTVIEFDDIIYEKSNPIITAQIGTKSVAQNLTSLATYTKFVLNFEASASEVNADIKAWLSGAGSVYLDSVSLTQAYDAAVVSNTKLNTDAAYQAIFHNNLSDKSAIDLYLTGTRVVLQVGDDTTYSAGNTPVGTIDKNIFSSIIAIYNRTANGSVHVNNVSKTIAFSMATIGKVIYKRPTYIGYREGGLRASGLIGSVQIIRFTNISQSNFDATTYKIGQAITGGGAETVLLLDWKDGTSITNALKDYGTGNKTVTAVNMDLTNRVRKI